MIKMFYVMLIVLLTSGSSFCNTVFPKKDWYNKPNPIASPYAEIGGEISIFGGQYHNSFNYYLDNNTVTHSIFLLLFDTLIDYDPLTYEYTPEIAEKWTISDDKKTFTFYINPKARWSDGKPITAEDVKWTYETIMSPKNMTGAHKVRLEKFNTPKVIDKHTIQFTTKTVHWQNIEAIRQFHILPKHAYEKKNFNKLNTAFSVVSGLYTLDKVEEGIYIKLERRNDWWAKDFPSSQNVGNFQTLKFRFYTDRSNAFEAFKKGMIDLYPIYTSRIWVNDTTGDHFSSNRIVKQRIFNYQPSSFQGFAMNIRSFPFDDIKVRKAMAYLLDRNKINQTLMYDQYSLHRSYYEDLYTPKNPCKNPLIPFDKNTASNLLKEAGWKINPKTGYLEKNGRKFSFKFLTRSPSTNKFLAIYSEALKDVGIELIIDAKDWAAWTKDMQEFNFQMTWSAWRYDVLKNPEDMWHSKEAERKSGSNYTGFRNKRVDALIEKQKTIFDLEKRNDIYRQIDSIVTQEFPYVLLWYTNATRLLYWNKFGTPDTVLSKYKEYESAYTYWWIDEDSNADLEDAIKNKKALPPKKRTIVFDEVFKMN